VGTSTAGTRRAAGGYVPSGVMVSTYVCVFTPPPPPPPPFSRLDMHFTNVCCIPGCHCCRAEDKHRAADQSDQLEQEEEEEEGAAGRGKDDRRGGRSVREEWSEKLEATKREKRAQGKMQQAAGLEVGALVPGGGGCGCQGGSTTSQGHSAGTMTVSCLARSILLLYTCHSRTPAVFSC
jgi:hypothetical protein